MGGIGFSELLLLALIALLVVGPRRLPEIARTAGQISRTARNAWQGLKSEFQAELDREHNRRVMEAESEPSALDGDDPDPRGSSLPKESGRERSDD